MTRQLSCAKKPQRVPLRSLIFAAALHEARRAPEHEVRQPVARELPAEREIPVHAERVDDVVRQAHDLAAEDHLVRSEHLGQVLADGEIATIEIAEMIRVDAEGAGNAQTISGGASSAEEAADDIRTPASGISERAARERSAALRLKPNVLCKERRADRVGVVDRDVLHADRVAGVAGREDVVLRDHRRTVVIGEEVAPADLCRRRF